MCFSEFLHIESSKAVVNYLRHPYSSWMKVQHERGQCYRCPGLQSSRKGSGGRAGTGRPTGLLAPALWPWAYLLVPGSLVPQLWPEENSTIGDSRCEGKKNRKKVFCSAST